MRLVCVGILLLTIYHQLSTTANAEKLHVSVYPPQVEIVIKPGKSLLQAIDLKNNGDTMVFSTSILSFEPSDDQGGRVFKDKAEGPLRFSLENSQMGLGDKFVLKSREKTQALLKIRAVENAPEGDYYYTLFFVADPPVTQTTAGLGRSYIGANILVSVTNSGNMPIEGKIAQLQVIPRYSLSLFGKTFTIVESNDEVPVVVKIANTGQFMVTPQVTLKLVSSLGKSETKKLFPANVLKNSQRLMVQEEFPECKRCKIPVSTVFKGWFFGKYTVSAAMTFEFADKKIYATTEFWAFPIRLMGLMGLISLVSLISLIRLMRHKKHTKKGGDMHGK